MWVWRFTSAPRSYQKGQIWIKRTILEMGGKNSILVCADSDVEVAVDGVVAAAFGFSGQKCSACSRAIVEAPVYDVFVERLRERVAKLTVGDPVTNQNMGPVVNKAALDSILGYIETGKKEGRLLAGGNAVKTEDGGYFLEPTVIADIAPDAVIAQEEIFGPVLAVIKVADFEEGLKVANNTEYGLTGAIYTGSREALDIARNEYHVGNLYLNRKCTGAMVGAHPFGGFNMRRDGFKGRRSGLPAAVHAGKERRREGVAERVNAHAALAGSVSRILGQDGQFKTGRELVGRVALPRPAPALRLQACCRLLRQPAQAPDDGW